MRSLRKWIKYLFPVLVVILLLGLIFSRVYQPESGSNLDPQVRVNAFEASDHIGITAEVCGRVASAEYVTMVVGDPTFLNLEQPHPDQPFTAIIWGEDRHHWQTPPDQLYNNREICVTGQIENHEGTPQIRVTSPEQIRER